MKKQVTLLLCLFSSLLVIHSQENKKIDSLSRLLTESSEKAVLLNELSEEYLIQSPQKALEFANDALDAANQENSQSAKADALCNIATAFMAFGNYDTSKVLLDKANVIYKELSDFEGQLKYKNGIAHIFFLSGNYVEAMEILEENLVSSEVLKYDEIKAVSLATIGRIHWLRGEYDLALQNYDSALIIAQELGNEYLMGTINLLTGLIYQSKGYLEIASGYFLSSQAYYEKVNSLSKLPYVYHYLGVIYYELREYDPAYDYLIRALGLMERNGDIWGKALVERYMGIIHLTWENYDSASFYMSESLELAQRMNDRAGEMYSLRFLGELYMAENQSDSAIMKFNESLTLANESGNIQEKVNILYNMGQLYKSQGNNAVSKKYFMQSKNLADSSDMLYENSINNHALAQIYDSEADYKSALTYFTRYKLLNDSIFNERKRKNIAEMQLKYETEKKNDQIQQLKQEKIEQEEQIKLHRLLIYSFAGMIVLILIIIAILIRYYIQKKKVNLTLSRQKEELQITFENHKKTQKQLIETKKMAALGSLVAGVAHELNTPVGITITAASGLQEETYKMAELYKENKLHRKEFKEFLNDSNHGLKLIMSNMEKTAAMVQSFKQISVDQTLESKRAFNLKEYTEDIIRSIYPKLKNRKISLKLDIDEKLEMVSYPGAFSQIFTNLLINSLTHGFDEIQTGQIEIIASQNDKELIIDYKDNGRGIASENLHQVFDPFFTTNKKTGTGLGMHIVYNLVTQKLKGSINCQSTEGMGVQFSLKLPI